jgi:hypothetical protein
MSDIQCQVFIAVVYHDQFTCTGTLQALEVNTMFFNGSARVQLWLGYPDKFYDSNKNLALNVRHEYSTSQDIS